jgi:hypothetical protein
MLATSKILRGSALLLAAFPVFAAEESSNAVAPAVLPSALVKCPGVTNIPMTADAEQALPLHIVGNLACGEVVSILADNEGYTAHIRTIDGKDGYVARMYLIEGVVSAAAAAPIRHASSATSVNGVVRWKAGAPGCDEFVSHGRVVESITANGITVQVSLQDTGWKYRANVAISNQSSANIDVNPGIVTLDELQPRLRPLLAAHPKLIAHTSTHQVFWTLADAVPSPSAVSAQQPRASAAQRQADRNSATPDYLNPKMTLASAHPSGFARTETVDVEAISMKYVSLPQAQNTAGVMWFARDAGAHELSLRVPVGDMVFDFAFAFEQKK